MIQRTGALAATACFTNTLTMSILYLTRRIIQYVETILYFFKVLVWLFHHRRMSSGAVFEREYVVVRNLTVPVRNVVIPLQYLCTV